MDFVEFVAGTASNILGELIGGTLGEKVTDFLFNKVTDAVSKNKAYKKYIDSGGTSGQRFKTFFDDLNTEINGRHSADKWAYKKAETTQKRAQLLLSEFCLYTGITADGIKRELEAYATYNAQDADFKQAIVAVLFDMRKYYAELKLSEDNKALITLLCSVIEDKTEENAEQIAKRVVAQLADRITLTGGAPTVENGVRVVVKGVTLTRLACPDCGKGILEELRSSSDGMFTCFSCKTSFAFGDLSNDLKEKITGKLGNAIEYLDAIYGKVDNLLLTVESLKNSTVTKSEIENIIDTYFEKSKTYLNENIGGALSDYLNYLKSESDLLLKEICGKLPGLTVEAAKAAKIKEKHDAIISELKEMYPKSSFIHDEASEYKHNDAFCALCFDVTEVNFDSKKIISALNAFPDLTKKRFGELIVNFIIQSTILPLNYKVYEALLSFAKGAEYYKHSYEYYKDLVDRRREQGFYRDDFENDMFVACSGKDEEKIEELLQYLDEHSTINYFYYKHHLIYDATVYNNKIDKALDSTKCFLFISSANSVKPDCEAVTYEMKHIRDIDKDNCQKLLGYIPPEMYAIHGKFPITKWVPRIWYSIDGVVEGQYTAINKKIKDFFGTIKIIYNKDELITEFDVLISDDEWHNADYWRRQGIDIPGDKERQKGGSNPPPPPVTPVTSGGKTEAEFVNSWYCVENLHENMPGAKVCAYCDCEQFYSKYDEYKNVYCSECLAPANRGAINCSACKAKRVKFINYFEMQQERTARKITSLMQEANSAFNKKDYEAAINSYSQAAELGNEEAKNKKTLAEQKAEAERKRREEKKRNAILNIGVYKDIGGGYVTFGTYPQSKKADNVTIGEIFDKERGYYLGSDNNLYVEYKGKYYKVEPIKWKVLQSGNEIFVVADDILGAHHFAERSNNYANSEVRKFLNSDFYSAAFNDSQKDKIVTTTVDNSLSSTGNSSNKYTCGNTTDKVFLLSNREAGQYIAGDEARKRVPTDYAVAKGARQSSNFKRNGKGCGWWWLRSPAFVNWRNVQGVYSDGSFYSSDVSSTYGVVPALKFKP